MILAVLLMLLSPVAFALDAQHVADDLEAIRAMDLQIARAVSRNPAKLQMELDEIAHRAAVESLRTGVDYMPRLRAHVETRLREAQQ